METIKFKTFFHGRFAIVEVNPWNQFLWHITTVNAEDSETTCGWQHCKLTKVSCSMRTTRWTFENTENLRFSYKREFEDFLKKNIFFEEIPFEDIF
jgi:hypothetical protein